jgi:hypothetical protein
VTNFLEINQSTDEEYEFLMAQISPHLEELEFLNMQHTAKEFNNYAELSFDVNCVSPSVVTADENVQVYVRILAICLCSLLSSDNCLDCFVHVWYRKLTSVEGFRGCILVNKPPRCCFNPWTTPRPLDFKGWFMAPYSPGLQTPHGDSDLLLLQCKTGISLFENIDSSQGYSANLPYKGAGCKGFPIQRTKSGCV